MEILVFKNEIFIYQFMQKFGYTVEFQEQRNKNER